MNCVNDCNETNYLSDVSISILDRASLKIEKRIDEIKLKSSADKRLKWLESSGGSNQITFHSELMQLMDEFFKFHLSIIDLFWKDQQIERYYQKWYPLSGHHQSEPIWNFAHFMNEALTYNGSPFHACFENSGADDFILLNHDKSVKLKQIGVEILKEYGMIKNRTVQENGSYIDDVYKPFLDKLNQDSKLKLSYTLEKKFLTRFLSTFRKFGECINDDNIKNTNVIQQQTIEDCAIKFTTLTRKKLMEDPEKLKTFQSIELTAVEDLQKFFSSLWFSAALLDEFVVVTKPENEFVPSFTPPFSNFDPNPYLDLNRRNNYTTISARKYMWWLNEDLSKITHSFTLSKAMLLEAEGINVVNMAQAYQDGLVLSSLLKATGYQGISSFVNDFEFYRTVTYPFYFQLFDSSIGQNADLYSVLLLEKQKNINVVQHLFPCLRKFHNNLEQFSELTVVKQSTRNSRRGTAWTEKFRNFVNNELKIYRPGIEYEQASLAKVDVYFRSFQYQEVLEKETYTFWKLLSDIGGNSGLWLGATLITLYETIVLFCLAKKSGETETTVMVEPVDNQHSN